MAQAVVSDKDLDRVAKVDPQTLISDALKSPIFADSRIDKPELQVVWPEPRNFCTFFIGTVCDN